MSTLATLKKMKISAINEKTNALIDKGFMFKDILFPTTEEDQRNYLGLNSIALDQLVTQTQMLDFASENRIKAKGLDANGNVAYYEFADCPDIIAFYATGVAFVNEMLQSGWALKDAVDAANSLEALALVVDNR